MPQCNSWESNSISNVRAKRSSAGKFRADRFLDRSYNDGRAASEEKSPAAGSGVEGRQGLNTEAVVAMRAPLRIHEGGDALEGLWVGDCIGLWRGNKLYSGALLGDQYVAVGADVYLKAQPGQLQVPICPFSRSSPP